MWQILIIPFLGTSLGAACVFFFKKAMGEKLQKAFTGFASGVMVSASFFSLSEATERIKLIHREFFTGMI